jgi:hypothetical protein
MSKLSKRETTLLVILIIALCGALYYNFVFKSYLATSSDIDVEKIDVSQSVSDLKMKYASIQMLDKNIKAIQDEMAPKFETVLESIDRPSIIVMLEKCLYPQATNVTYQFSPSYDNLNSNFITSVQVSFQCTPQGFRQILMNLRSADHVNRVLSSSLVLADPVTTESDASITIEILTKSVLPTGTSLGS